MSRYLVKATGMTAYAAVYGEEYRKEIVHFGEAIMIKIPVPDHRRGYGQESARTVAIPIRSVSHTHLTLPTPTSLSLCSVAGPASN